VTATIEDLEAETEARHVPLEAARAGIIIRARIADADYTALDHPGTRPELDAPA
jgi:hypothetical protein